MSDIEWRRELYVPAGVPLPPLPAFPSPPPPVFPSPTPARRRSRRRSVPFRRTLGPGRSRSTTRVPSPRRCSWPRTSGTLRLVGSATPNVVPAGATVKVTFRFPAKGADDGWIYVNPRPGEGGAVGQRGPDRHPRQDLDPGGRRGGLVEPVAGKHRAERLRRLACAGHALRVSRKSYRSRMAAGIAFS